MHKKRIIFAADFRTMKDDRFFRWFFPALLLVVITAGLHSPLIVNAAKYAEVSREILENRDWINLTIAGEPYEQKPPLMFWIGAVFFNLFGVSAPVWRIAFYLISALGIYSTYRLGRLLYDETVGRYAALFWMTSLGYLHYHNDIHTDTLLADTVIFSVWQLAAFFRNKKAIHFYAGIAGTGLSMLAKGPVGLAIPVFAVGSNLLFHHKWRDIFHPRWIAATVMVAIMLMPAFIGLYNQSGKEGIWFYFWTNNMGRITGSYYGNNSDPFYYLHTSLYVLAPFVVFAIAGTIVAIRKLLSGRKTSTGSNELYIVGAILPYLIILSVAKTKNPHYLVTLGPFFMILGARFARLLYSGEVSESLKRTVTWMNGFIVVLIWMLILVFPTYLFPEKNGWFWLLLILFASITAVSLVVYRGVMRQTAVLALTCLAFIFSLNFSFYPSMQKYHAPLSAVRDFNQKALPGEHLHIYKPASRYWEIFFYSKNPGKYFPDNSNLSTLLKESGEWVFTDQEGCEEISGLLPQVQIAAEYNHHSLSRISLPFLNPGKRSTRLSRRYLLHLP
jgi:4-amino-4-deoxy-L-arabinose transferase-like glycosyltransferase